MDSVHGVLSDPPILGGAFPSQLGGDALGARHPPQDGPGLRAWQPHVCGMKKRGTNLGVAQNWSAGVSQVLVFGSTLQGKSRCDFGTWFRAKAICCDPPFGVLRVSSDNQCNSKHAHQARKDATRQKHLPRRVPTCILGFEGYLCFGVGLTGHRKATISEVPHSDTSGPFFVFGHRFHGHSGSSRAACPLNVQDSKNPPTYLVSIRPFRWRTSGFHLGSFEKLKSLDSWRNIGLGKAVSFSMGSSKKSPVPSVASVPGPGLHEQHPLSHGHSSKDDEAPSWHRTTPLFPFQNATHAGSSVLPWARSLTGFFFRPGSSPRSLSGEPLRSHFPIFRLGVKSWSHGLAGEAPAGSRGVHRAGAAKSAAGAESRVRRNGAATGVFWAWPWFKTLLF